MRCNIICMTIRCDENQAIDKVMKPYPRKSIQCKITSFRIHMYFILSLHLKSFSNKDYLICIILRIHVVAL